jgi:hypothetical protein
VPFNCEIAHASSNMMEVLQTNKQKKKRKKEVSAGVVDIG